MDLITQGILGAAVAEAGWRHKLGKGAILAGILFGLMPDFDVISSLWGPWASIVHHRGFTHSIFFAPLMAPIGGYVAWRLSKRRGELTSWMHCAFWALLTHPLLDVFTVYGTQLLTPLDNTRFSLDGVSIIDPLYTFPLLFALILAWFFKTKPRLGQRITQAALILTTLYLGLGYMTAQNARQATQTQLERADVITSRVRATPTMANLVLWRVFAEDTQGDLHAGLYSVTKKNDITFHTKKHLESTLIERALLDRRAQLFKWFAQDWVSYRVEESASQTILYMDDARYGGVLDPLKSMWGAKITFDEELNVVNVERVNYRGRNTDDLGDEIDALWKGITEGP